MNKFILGLAAVALLVGVALKLNRSGDDQVLVVPPIPAEISTANESATNPSPLIDMSPAERKAFRSEVRAYLLENPEVLMEAIQVLEQRQQQAQVKNDTDLVTAIADDVYNDGFSYVGGNPDGDVVLVEYVDYRCAFCRKAHFELQELLETDGNIRFIVKEFPILGEQSTISSRLAIATLHKAGPEAYHELGNFLITFNGNLTEPTIRAVLEKQGLNADEIMAYMDDPAVLGQIAAVNRQAASLQITGTPTFVLGGDMLRGYVPLADMRDLVAQVREARN
ncbi:MAG: DsbA family protein [Alphaproteobacteria bacterium]|nr:DsbA family protein [Alphaproteobacteria bacterium]